MNFKPLGDRVLVEPAPIEETTSSGIIIPDSAKGKPNKGRVVAVSSNKDLVLEEGNSILYNQNAGTSVKVDDKEYLVMRESEVMAIIK